MAEQGEREVNTGPVVESETLKPELDKDTEVETKEEDDGEETIVSAEEAAESTEESTEESKETTEETTDEEATEENSEEEKEETTEEPASESSPEEEEAPEQLKPVKGETPRERALRFEVTRLKREKRKDERESLIGKGKPVESQDDIYKELREKYTEEEIKNSEVLVDTIARAKGFVRKDEAYENTANEVLEGFFETNSEYNPENDTDDIHWNSFKRNLADYNLTNKTASQLLAIYKKVDRDVKKELGEVTTEKRDTRKIETQKQKIKSVSHSGGTKSSPSKKSDIDPAVRAHFKGFEKGDLD